MGFKGDGRPFAGYLRSYPLLRPLRRQEKKKIWGQTPHTSIGRGLLRPWGQYIRTVTVGKIPGGSVAKRKSKRNQCAKRRDTLKPSSASCVQKSPIVWSVKASCNGVSRFQIA